MFSENKTCLDCTFRIGNYCRRFPPTVIVPGKFLAQYPAIVANENRVKDACGEYIFRIK